MAVGRWATVGGILLSIATAFAAINFNNIMDTLQLVFSFVNAPLFATFLLGMFWKRATGSRRICGAHHRHRGGHAASRADAAH
jgi:SSS family solute:Na+ symporter